MKKGKYVICLTIVLGVGLLFTACSKQKKETPTKTMAETKSIVIWTNFENEAEILQTLGSEWSAETGISVKVIHESLELQQFAQATKSKDGPDGIFGLPNDQLANYVSAGLAREVPEGTYNFSDYSDAAVQACYADGKLYGVPIAVETITLFYNADKVNEAPETWDELVKMSKNTGGIQFDATSVYYDLGFLRAFGGYIFKYEDGKYDVSDIGLGGENAVKAYTTLNSMVENGFFGADISFDLARSSFQNGESAFYIGGPWDVTGFTDAGLSFGVTAMPTLNGIPLATPVGTQVGFVSSKSEDQDATWDFYQFLMEKSPRLLFDMGGRIPAGIEAQRAISADDATQAFIDQIANGEPMPTVSELGQVWTPYSDNMKLMFQGDITPEEAAVNIQAQVKEGIDYMNSGK